MRLIFIALMGCLACDSSASKAVAVPAIASPEASPSHEAVSPAPVSPAPISAVPAGPEAGASHDGARSEPRLEGKSDCRFQRPTLWAGGEVSWLGSCRKGFADGNGVLVNAVEGAVPERFYGRLEQGSPRVGVLQTDGGFMAGRWANGAVVAALADDVAQRNVMIDAFRVAANAATGVSKSSSRKDAASKSFYAKQARLLREQMD